MGFNYYRYYPGPAEWAGLPPPSPTPTPTPDPYFYRYYPGPAEWAGLPPLPTATPTDTPVETPTPTPVPASPRIAEDIKPLSTRNSGDPIANIVSEMPGVQARLAHVPAGKQVPSTNVPQQVTQPFTTPQPKFPGDFTPNIPTVPLEGAPRPQIDQHTQELLSQLFGVSPAIEQVLQQPQQQPQQFLPPWAEALIRGYLMAISTPKYMGIGAAMARGGLAALDTLGQYQTRAAEAEKQRMQELKARVELAQKLEEDRRRQILAQIGLHDPLLAIREQVLLSGKSPEAVISAVRAPYEVEKTLAQAEKSRVEAAKIQKMLPLEMNKLMTEIASKKFTIDEKLRTMQLIDKADKFMRIAPYMTPDGQRKGLRQLALTALAVGRFDVASRISRMEKEMYDQPTSKKVEAEESKSLYGESRKAVEEQKSQ